MNKIKIFIKTETLPLFDQKEGLSLFFRFFCKQLQQEGIFIDGQEISSTSCIAFIGEIIEVKSKKIKGPAENEAEAFKEKYKNAEFLKENGRIFAVVKTDMKKKLVDLLETTIKTHNWSSKTKWDDSDITAARPIRKISIKLDEEFLTGKIGNLYLEKFEEKFLSFEERFNRIKSLVPFGDEKLIKENTAIANDPELLSVNFKEDYLSIPYEILKYFIEKEHQGFLKENESKCYLIVEKGLKLNEKNFSRGINNKLYDLSLMYKRDTEKTEEFYRSFTKEENLQKKMLDVFLKLNKINQKVKAAIELFFFDIGSEIVSEIPSLSGLITEHFYPSIGRLVYNSKINPQTKEERDLALVFHISRLVMAQNNLPKGDRDPFGLKKSIDFIANYMLEIHFFDTSILENVKEIVLNKVKSKISEKNSYFQFLNEFNEEVIKLNPIFDKDKINRIAKIVEKTVCTEEISSTEDEKRLVKKIEDTSLKTLNEMIDEVIEYIDKVRISPYKNRLLVVKLALEKVKQFIQIEKMFESVSKL